MSLKSIKYDPFYRGDTPNFTFTFISPSEGYDWSGVQLDAAFTNIDAPTNNAGAVLRQNRSLAVQPDNSATYDFQLTTDESNALVVGTYHVQVQLKDSGGSVVATVLTGTVSVVQDYVI